MLVALLSVDYKGLMQQLSARAALLLSSIGAVATIFLAMLVTWTPHPALYIDGVQGRYFLIPALLIAYALSGQAIWLNRPKVEKTIMITVFFFALYCAVITMNVLVERYYISAN